MRALTIWTNFHLSDDKLASLRHEVEPHELIYSSSATDPELARADIAFGQPDPQQVIELTKLRWVQISSAGYTKYDREDLWQALRSRGAVLTNSSSVFDEPCAQHLLAMILSMTRQLPAALDNQRGPRSWTVDQIRAESRLLKGQHVLLVGFGAIGRRLSEMLRPFGVEMIGVRRSPKGDEPIRVVAVDQGDEFLAWADHVVDILPLSPSTANFFSAERFARLRPTALFYNIGRGRTVDQDALHSALASHKLAGAYLDVTTPEPLPPDHPLWTTKNCCITPHTGGGHLNERDRQVEHFVQNLKRFEGGQRLLDRVI
ncbi:MAG TPA: D-2-hydroxyacid dehydrogenase [Tepidisphaeraceae bacterium]|jgi:phosphoglycerate dehydrogenase-like enzyme